MVAYNDDGATIKAVIVHFVCMIALHGDGITLVRRLYCAFCVHGYMGYTPLLWDNESPKAAIVHFVCMVTHYGGGTAIAPGL